MPSKGDAPDKRPAVTLQEYALFCWLRLHQDVAKTYGIKECNGNTSIGSMLFQTLNAQGMHVDWYERLDAEPDGTANEKAAAYIKRVGRRPGAHMKQLSERPEVAPPDHAAVLRHHGRLPRAAFPKLVELSAQRRQRRFNSLGNEIVAPKATALIERQLLVTFVEITG